MSKTKTLSTSERIVDAAAEVFTRKGFAATTTRDIAAAAEVNIATLHYHHQSKEVLFQRVADRAMGRFNTAFEDAMDGAQTLGDFVEAYVREYTELLLEHPYLGSFVMSETEKNPEAFAKTTDFKSWHASMGQLLERERAAGRTVPASVDHFVCDLVGAMIYPFMCKSTMMRAMGMDEAQFAAFVRGRAAHLGTVLG